MNGIELLVYLMDDAFGAEDVEDPTAHQSLMSNLDGIDDATWRQRLPESIRTIESIALHVGSCKVMYRDHAFGSRALTWESPEVQPWPVGEAPLKTTLVWLRQTHADLMREVSELTDVDLFELRWANWGEQKQTRWLLSMLLQHDTYHAGEINRMRSVLSGEDRWAWQIYEGIDAVAAR